MTRSSADKSVVSYRQARTATGDKVHITVHGKYNVRDQIGHFVGPPRMEDHPCPHHCCQGKSVHPANLPVKLNRTYLRSLSQGELETELGQYGKYSEIREKGFFQVIAELNRREDSEKRTVARKERATRHRQDRESEYKDEVYRQWLTAESFTNGYMLNKAGKKAGIDERTLFTGPESRVAKYASPELVEYFESHPRPTRASWFGSAQSKRAHLAGRRIGLNSTNLQNEGALTSQAHLGRIKWSTS